MTPDDRYLLVRAASLYVAVMATAMAWLWRRPSPRAVAGAALATMWNLPAILLLHVAAVRYGWWQFDAQGGLLLGMPVDLYLAWACLWGAAPALAFPSWPLSLVVLIALAVDLVLMPAAAPVIRLSPDWLLGEAVGLAIGLVPGQLLARWTHEDRRLAERALLQVLGFSGVLLFVVPAIAIDGSGGVWRPPFDRPGWQISLIVQLLAVPALVGVTAVQEFATRGGGTPVPFDPPRMLVTTGIYAYVRNPMQLSAMVLLAMLGVVLGNFWIGAAGVVTHSYSVGFAGWHEDEELRRRFGDAWTTYRRSVRRWVPRFRPWHAPERPPAQLFVAETCDMCREVARWFERRGVRHLTIVPAETHPSGELRRITYEPGDGTRAAWGIEAIARAIEHIHVGWALAGFLLRLPVVRETAQLLIDVSGGDARTIRSSRLTSDSASGHALDGVDPRPTSSGPAPTGIRCEAKGGILPDSRRSQLSLRRRVRAAGERLVVRAEELRR